MSPLTADIVPVKLLLFGRDKRVRGVVVEFDVSTLCHFRGGASDHGFKIISVAVPT